MAAGQVSTSLSEWLLIALIVFTLVFEIGLHRLEHWVNHKHGHLQVVLKVLYRELMVLGIVSFSFVVYELTAKPNGDVILSFEFAHVFIFLFAIFYTSIVLSTMFISLRLSTRWKQTERMDLVHYLSLKDKYNTLRAVVNLRKDAFWRHLWWFPNLPQLIKYTRMHEVMTFHDIRFQFIYYRNLPGEFRFSSFLRKIKSIAFVELVESHWSLYVIFLFVVLCDIFRRNVISHDEDILRRFISAVPSFIEGEATPSPTDVKEKESRNRIDAILVVCASILLALFTQLLAVKIRRVYWELTKHPRMYYDGLQAETVAEEFRKAAEQREETRQERRRSRSVSISRNEGIDTGNDADVDDDLKRGLNIEQGSTLDNTTDAGSELLDPMHPPPLKSPLLPPSSPHDGAGPSSINDSGIGFRHSIDRAKRPTPASYRSHSTNTHQKLSNKGHSNRGSIDGSINNDNNTRLSIDGPQQRAMTDLEPSTLAQHRVSINDADEFGPHNGGGVGQGGGGGVSDMPVRHSLDGRPRVSTPVATHEPKETPSSTTAILGRAAVQAARKRALTEGTKDIAQESGDKDQPGDSTPTMMSRKVGSPRLLSALSSRRGSIDDDVIQPPSFRASIDSNRNGGGSNSGRRGGGRMSIELAVVMARDELAEQFEGKDDRNGRRKVLNGRPLPAQRDQTFRDSTDSGYGGGRKEQRIRFSVSDKKESSENLTNGGEVLIDVGLPEQQEGGGGGLVPKHPDGSSSFASLGDIVKSEREASGLGDDDGVIENFKVADDIEIMTESINNDADEIRKGKGDGYGYERNAEMVDKQKRGSFTNNTILKNFEDLRDAENLIPTYPRWVTKLIPRLGRVASRVEKLFWFGSHKFFLWCVEFVLFFSTVLLSAACAGVVLLAVTDEAIKTIHIVSLVLAGANLLFVLLRIAVIIKRYIFILHNASLIPEVEALEAIEKVRSKKVSTRDDRSSMSGSETEREDDDAARERRRRLAGFFRSEAESGNVPGIGSGVNSIRQSADFGILRRRNRRKMARRRRESRRWGVLNQQPPLEGVDVVQRDSVTISETDDTEQKSGILRNTTMNDEEQQV